MEKKMNVYETPMTEIMELEVEQALLTGSGSQNEGWDFGEGNE
jgi:hypothetical protein